MVQSRRTFSAGSERPARGISRSRKVRTKLLLQATLSASDAASSDRGNPPRIHNWSRRLAPTSARSNPSSSTNSIRPASVSDEPRTSSVEALPSSRNRTGSGSRSANTLSTGSNSGICWISSSTTIPFRSRRASMGSARRARSGGDSRSKNSAPVRAARARAKVVLPHWRGPRSAVMGARLRACSRRSSCRALGITSLLYS